MYIYIYMHHIIYSMFRWVSGLVSSRHHHQSVFQGLPFDPLTKTKFGLRVTSRSSNSLLSATASNQFLVSGLHAVTPNRGAFGVLTRVFGTRNKWRQWLSTALVRSRPVSIQCSWYSVLNGYEFSLPFGDRNSVGIYLLSRETPHLTIIGQVPLFSEVSSCPTAFLSQPQLPFLVQHVCRFTSLEQRGERNGASSHQNSAISACLRGANVLSACRKRR